MRYLFFIVCAYCISCSCGTGYITTQGTQQSQARFVDHDGQITSFAYQLFGDCAAGEPISVVALETTVIVASSSCDQTGLLAIELLFQPGAGIRRIVISQNDEEQTVELDFVLSCPSGFVGVPGNVDLDVADFCVAKYEMKAQDLAGETVADGSGGGSGLNRNNHAPVSVASGTPWVRISQTNARLECEEIGTTLISNAQWQTLARNIELNKATWLNDNGVLRLSRGNTAGSSVVAASTDDDGYFGTSGLATQAYGAGLEQRRTFSLSNGEIIWDVSANAKEMMRDVVSVDLTPSPSLVAKPTMDFSTGSGCTGGCFSEGTLNRTFFAPYDLSIDNDFGVGRFVSSGGLYEGVILRSLRGNFAGIYSVRLDELTVSTASSDVTGFRCAALPLID